ncbi:uncharacterized protein LOC135073873 [Ostrinia nubilalis]|uniref:uncharacterized protein LOC135073873 n=1 Tax=Ostrinia nubilalis TaxID=29057 RepID=UPI0030824390
MTIPPFPSQDLAKLVLGYLAEEQLMTAYDEFLQASPYLDAFGNEYDRIFMTSLKNILAEYRAVKIYVETCKPFALRRKIFQCTNLLEIVKLLIQYVDINKLQAQESNQNKYSAEKQSVGNKANVCEVCNSLKLDSCTCKNKSISLCSSSATQISTSSVENSVETTSLSDLPGNHITCRKKNPRVLSTDQTDSQTNESIEPKTRLASETETVEKNLSTSASSHNKVQDASQNPSTLGKSDSLENKQKEEFYNILNQMCKKNETVINTSSAPNPGEKGRVSVAGYNEFATGVSGGEGVNIVPDSSTSENLHAHVPSTKDTNNSANLDKNSKKKQTRTQYLLKTTNSSGMPSKEVVSINTVCNNMLPKLKPKTDENKITILSDIKVDNNESLGAATNLPLKAKNATSTPLLQMQTILINGTPVYKHQHLGQSQNYTKDEIMAMPTIILAPAPDPTLIRSQAAVVGSAANQCIPMTSSSARPLGPLIIDVTSDSTAYLNQINNPNPALIPQIEQSTDKHKDSSSNAPKVPDITSASAPKDNTVTSNIETSTPQVLPPLRKSSSTPRRTSHVRVLDFTTPRRILHETINEGVPEVPDSNDVEIILSQSPNISIPSSTEKVVSGDKVEDNNASLTENSIKPKGNVINWDADLRKHARASELSNVQAMISPKPKPKPRPSRKKKTTRSSVDDNTEDTVEDKCNTKKKTPKTKVPKRKCSIDEASEIITIPDEKIDVLVKPTINIIPRVPAELAKDQVPSSSNKNHKVQNKSNSDDNIDTPEMERMSLQNEIGAKLNISDLLETPYKQALYDIQMETPRFLGPDIPDDPMSDIKIMNIPTPRFLANATPSSYSSRPTDYSSGGSYYKPDDQDYMRIQDDLDCPVTSTKDNTTNNSLKDDSDSKEKENLKPSRPVRECTKNVSYRRGKQKHVGNKEDCESCLDSVNLADLAAEKATPKSINNKSKLKTKPLSVKKTKSVKKDKSFMKIKPRRPTPTKKDGRGRKRIPISDPSNQSKVQTRRKANKDNSPRASPAVTCAPTKSRRKSSTPRKLHCSKSFNSESLEHESPEFVTKSKEKIPDSNVAVQDSDTEQLPLRWSDDGSQEPKHVIVNVPIEAEDISKIQKYIENTVTSKPNDIEGSLHIDLVKRGFDIETAKIIERDLLDSTLQETPAKHSTNLKLTNPIVVVDNKPDNAVLEKTLESDCSTNLQIVQNDEEEEDDEIELSVHECHEESANYISCSYDATKESRKTELTKLKDKFCMEVCIDDGVSIRLRATPFSLTLDQDPSQAVEYFDYSYRETEMAVSSIANMDKLYTPLKDAIKAQCYEIFDSTLTSLDTPLKVSSPTRHKETEVSVTEIVLEVEKVEVKEKAEGKKRKRVHSGNMSDEGSGDSNKKTKTDPQYNLFSSANIQNIDIESVLSKLHGP